MSKPVRPRQAKRRIAAPTSINRSHLRNRRIRWSTNEGVASSDLGTIYLSATYTLSATYPDTAPTATPSATYTITAVAGSLRFQNTLDTLRAPKNNPVVVLV